MRLRTKVVFPLGVIADRRYNTVGRVGGYRGPDRLKVYHILSWRSQYIAPVTSKKILQAYTLTTINTVIPGPCIYLNESPI